MSVWDQYCSLRSLEESKITYSNARLIVCELSTLGAVEHAIYLENIGVRISAGELVPRTIEAKNYFPARVVMHIRNSLLFLADGAPLISKVYMSRKHDG
jgi:hypothetical protein